MRKVILTACALLVAGLSAGCVIQIPPTFRHETSPIEQSVGFEDAQGFAVDLKHANVTIEGWNQPTVAMTAKVWAQAYSDASARELAEKTRVELKRSGGRVVVECVAARPLLANEQVGVELTVRLPSEAVANVVTRFGNVSATDVAGAIELRTDYGEITLRASQAPVRCETKYGNIVLEDASAAVDCRSGYGDITLRRPGGPVHCSTKYGGIKVTGARDALECATAYGNIEASIAPGHWKGQTIKLETKYGKVKLDLPTQTGG